MRTFFGGPDQAADRLLNVLAERIEAVPAGGEIHWVCYYFRNLELADALLRAKRRGVKLRVCVDAKPRVHAGNQVVVERLRAGGIDRELRAVRHFPLTHMHTKLYIFSHPKPVALIGSFDPSGAAVEDPEVILQIGDQNRGHNYLVEISDPTIVDALRRHVLWLWSSTHTHFERLAPQANAVPKNDHLTVFFFPRFYIWVLARMLAARRYERVQLSVSHFHDATMLRRLARLIRSGTKVEVIAHHTERRVPRKIEQRAKQIGALFQRYRHPLDLPMHSKFILLTAPGSREVIFGSMNLTYSSRWISHEILAHSTDETLFDAFAERWDHLRAEMARFEAANGRSDGVSDTAAHGASEGRLGLDPSQS